MNKQIRLANQMNQMNQEDAKEVATMNSNVNISKEVLELVEGYIKVRNYNNRYGQISMEDFTEQKLLGLQTKFYNVKNFALANGFDVELARMSIVEDFSFMEVVKACETANHSVSAVYRKVRKNRGEVEGFYRPFVSKDEWEAKVAPERKALEAEMEPIHAWNDKYNGIKSKLTTKAQRAMLEMLRNADWLRIKKHQPMMSKEEMKAFVERNAEAVLKRNPEDHSNNCVYLNEAHFSIGPDPRDLELDMDDEDNTTWITKHEHKYDLSFQLTEKGKKLGLLRPEPNAPLTDRVDDPTYISLYAAFTMLKVVRQRHTVAEYRNRHDTSGNTYLPHGVKEAIFDFHGVTIKAENVTLRKDEQQEWFDSRTKDEYLQDVEDDALLRSIEAKLETAVRLYKGESQPITTKGTMTLIHEKWERPQRDFKPSKYRPCDYYEYEVVERNGEQWVNSIPHWYDKERITVVTNDIYIESMLNRNNVKVKFTEAEMNVLRRLDLAE